MASQIFFEESLRDHRIQKPIYSNGKSIAIWRGRHALTASLTIGMSVDSGRNVYVAELGNARVQMPPKVLVSEDLEERFHNRADAAVLM